MTRLSHLAQLRRTANPHLRTVWMRLSNRHAWECVGRVVKTGMGWRWSQDPLSIPHPSSLPFAAPEAAGKALINNINKARATSARAANSRARTA